MKARKSLKHHSIHVLLSCILCYSQVSVHLCPSSKWQFRSWKKRSSITSLLNFTDQNQISGLREHLRGFQRLLINSSALSRWQYSYKGSGDAAVSVRNCQGSKRQPFEMFNSWFALGLFTQCVSFLTFWQQFLSACYLTRVQVVCCPPESLSLFSEEYLQFVYRYIHQNILGKEFENKRTNTNQNT